VPISIQDDSFKSLSIGGTFQVNSEGVDALLEMLERGLGVRVRRDGNAHIYMGEISPR
jgi:ferric-dicitrate binding protein FerR (iron transport regulator)